MSSRRLTPIQQKMMAVLSDGGEHPRNELQDCMDDPRSTSFTQYLTGIRNYLRGQGKHLAYIRTPDGGLYQIRG